MFRMGTWFYFDVQCTNKATIRLVHPKSRLPCLSLTAIFDFAIVSAVALVHLIFIIFSFHDKLEGGIFKIFATKGEKETTGKDICAVLYRFVKPYSKRENDVL